MGGAQQVEIRTACRARPHAGCCVCSSGWGGVGVGGQRGRAAHGRQCAVLCEQQGTSHQSMTEQDAADYAAHCQLLPAAPGHTRRALALATRSTLAQLRRHACWHTACHPCHPCHPATPATPATPAHTLRSNAPPAGPLRWWRRAAPPGAAPACLPCSWLPRGCGPRPWGCSAAAAGARRCCRGGQPRAAAGRPAGPVRGRARQAGCEWA